MRTVKFRGIGIDGKTYYGDLYHTRHEVGIHVIGDGVFEVKPETVAQLVGYDSNGAEIYEGDTLIDEKGFTYTAFLQPSVEWEREKEMKDFFGWHGAPLAVAEQFAKLTIKEAAEHAAD